MISSHVPCDKMGSVEEFQPDGRGLKDFGNNLQG